jgi:hypothetical protein
MIKRLSFLSYFPFATVQKKRIASEGQVLLSAHQVSEALGDATGSEQ